LEDNLMSNLRDFIGSSGGSSLPIGSSIYLEKDDSLIALDDKSVLLKSGVIETEDGVYPDAKFGADPFIFETSKLFKESKHYITHYNSDVGGKIFDSTGLHFYSQNGNNTIHGIAHYELSTPYDIKTKTLANTTNENMSEISCISDDGKWIYSRYSSDLRRYELTIPWDISTIVLKDKKNDFGYNPSCVNVANDGYTLLLGDSGSDVLYLYNLSTPYDINSATSTGTIDLTADPDYVQISPDGTKVYVYLYGDDLLQYTLSVPFSFSGTESLDYTLDVGAASDNSFTISNDGTKLIVFNANSYSKVADIYVLGTPFDISTAVLQSNTSPKQFDFTAPYQTQFNNDGTKLFILNTTTDDITRYSLNPAWDISTAVSDSITFDPDPDETEPMFFNFNNDGTKLFILGTTQDRIISYTLSPAWDVSSAVKLSSGPVDSKMVEFYFNDDGSKIYISRILGGTVNVAEYNLSTPYDISLLEMNPIYLDDGLFTGTYLIRYNTDGTKVYILGSDTDTIYQYDLSTPYDINTRTYTSKTLDVSSEDTLGYSFCFNSTGTKIYYMGYTNDTVYQYTLGTAWDLSTGSYDSVSQVFTENSTFFDIKLSSDDSKLYLLGGYSYVYQYTMSTDQITSASYDSQNVYTNSIYSFNFSSDGSYIFLAGSGFIKSYKLGTAWDLSTEVVDYTYTNGDFGTIRGIDFNADGTKMTTSYGSLSIVIFDLSTPYDSSTITYNPSQINNYLQVPENLLSMSSPSIRFCNSGNNIMLGDSTHDIILNYKLSTAWDLNTISEVYSDYKCYYGYHSDFNITPTGDYLYYTSYSSIYQVPMAVNFDLASAYPVLDGNNDVKILSSSYDLEPKSSAMFFSPDGKKLTILGANTFQQYHLSTPYDLDSVTFSEGEYSSNFNSSADNTITVSKDYIIRRTSATSVAVSRMLMPWDPATNSSFSDQTCTLAIDANKYYKFSHNGFFLYTFNDTYNLESYTLRDKWIMTNFQTGDSLQMGEDINNFIFSEDGTKLYFLTISGNILIYNLTIPWLLRYATLENSISLDSNYTYTGLAINNTGTKFFVFNINLNLIEVYSTECYGKTTPSTQGNLTEYIRVK